ncbi:hypothetical protein MMC12_006702 [Toensbergia leucococca]|nr:hypothetical protein [Toensbergia leucococca]
MRATLLYVLTNPTVYLKLRKEILSATSDPARSGPIQLLEALKMPYLQACIKEGLRIFPPVTALRERVVPSRGDEICGIYVPQGVNIGLNTKGLLRNKNIFGRDSDVFLPERWLDQDIERLASMDRVYGLVFGAGSTRCLGVRIATMSLNKFFVEVRQSPIFFFSVSGR